LQKITRSAKELTDADNHISDHNRLKAMNDQATSPCFRYQLLATVLESQINGGLYKAGDRLPSLRTLQSRTGLSITTINLAYVEMEK